MARQSSNLVTGVVGLMVTMLLIVIYLVENPLHIVRYAVVSPTFTFSVMMVLLFYLSFSSLSACWRGDRERVADFGDYLLRSVLLPRSFWGVRSVLTTAKRS